MQGVVRIYDPDRGGIVVRDADRAELGPRPGAALTGSLFRMLRQGQRVNFELDGEARIVHVRIGAEADLGLPSAQV